MTDPEIDLAALTKAKNEGFRGIFISNDPLEQRRYDNPIWDKFWSAVEEYDMPVNVHILTRRAARRSAPTRWSTAWCCRFPPSAPSWRWS